MSRWPTYQGRHIGTDDIRAWYQQVEGFREQRLLFKILQGLKFIGEEEIREKATVVYAQVRSQLQEFVRYKLTDRRADIILTYLDGHGKSGEYFAGLFAEENKISVDNIVTFDKISDRLELAKKTGKPISAVVVVDDISASGRTLADASEAFLRDNEGAFREHGCKFILCALYSTRQAVNVILSRLRKFPDIASDFRYGELIADSSFAFSEESQLWANADERERAKALATDIGVRIYKQQPLGFGGLGLLVAFPTTVPNNTIPILHSRSKSSSKPWRPLLPRPTN